MSVAAVTLDFKQVQPACRQPSASVGARPQQRRRLAAGRALRSAAFRRYPVPQGLEGAHQESRQRPAATTSLIGSSRRPRPSTRPRSTRTPRFGTKRRSRTPATTGWRCGLSVVVTLARCSCRPAASAMLDRPRRHSPLRHSPRGHLRDLAFCHGDGSGDPERSQQDPDAGA